MKDGLVQFGYTGQRTADVAEGIRVSDVSWLCRYLGALTDTQISRGLDASGATAEEARRFTRAIRARIGQLQAAAGTHAPSAAQASEPRVGGERPRDGSVLADKQKRGREDRPACEEDEP